MNSWSIECRTSAIADALIRLAAAVVLVLAAQIAAAREGAQAPQLLRVDDPVREVGFLALDLESGRRWVVAPATLDVRRSPFSTFKIPNLLIALDTGVAESLDHRIEWDPAHRPAGDHWPGDWAQPQTLNSAFRRSAVWYFRDLALAIGGPTYRQALAAFGYGNAAAPDGSDLFWLDGTLRISLREQVGFLARLVRGELPIEESSVDALREAARLDEREGRVLFGKTGAGPVDTEDFDGPFRGWLVGWVERPDGAPVVYALYVAGPDWGSIARFRREAAERLLADTGAWPRPKPLDD